jgi:hypothetical protein
MNQIIARFNRNLIGYLAVHSSDLPITFLNKKCAAGSIRSSQQHTWNIERLTLDRSHRLGKSHHRGLFDNGHTLAVGFTAIGAHVTRWENM